MTARPAFELADVFRRHGEGYERANAGHLRRVERRVIRAVTACRTAALGGHVERCEDCGFTRIAYNSCRNRHCPKCQGSARVEWLAARQAELLPVPYFHVVFTLPLPAAEIAFQNKRTVYALLMRTAAEALMTLAARRLSARIGLIAVLHSWGQTLTHHPHVHCLVPGGGVALDGERWLACKPNFLLSVHALSRTFRRIFLDSLDAAFRRGELGFFGNLARLAERGAFAERVNALRQSSFVVYAKPPFGGPERVLAYLARYTHRTAIANSRLLAVDDDEVAFSYRDYRRTRRSRVMRLAPHEFIRRFLMHVLPDGFHRIRHMWTASWQVVFDALIALVGCGHMWTASWQVVFDALIALVGCGHMSGLLARYRTAGPDDIRQSWSLSLRRARGSWRMSGCPGLSSRPCRSSRRCACQSLRN